MRTDFRLGAVRAAMDIRSIAVAAEDVVTAAETNRTSDRTAVLRVTPPLSGRKRARLHVRLDGDSDAEALYISPDTLLSADAPSYPRPAETEDRLRADPEVEYTVERHREYHERAVEEWRDATADAIRESVTVGTGGETTEVTVHVLG